MTRLSADDIKTRSLGNEGQSRAGGSPRHFLYLGRFRVRERIFFGTNRDFKENYLKKLRKKRL